MNKSMKASLLCGVLGVGMLTGSAIHAANPVALFNDLSVSEKVGLSLFVAAFSRMIIKSENDKPMECPEYKRLRNGQFSSELDRVKSALKALVDLVDNKIIGSPGKPGGLRVDGSKVVCRPDCARYGVMGTAFSYFLPVWSNFKTLIDFKKGSGEFMEFYNEMKPARLKK